MAWIESHSSLKDHPKLYRLMHLLGVSYHEAIGIVQCLWWWGVDYVPDGDLSSFEPWEVATALRWQGDADKLMDALIKSGFLDRTEDGLFIHDWMDYAGKLIERREKDAERKRQERTLKSKKKDGTVVDMDVQRTSEGRPEDIRRTSDGCPALPNLTVPNHITTTTTTTTTTAHARDGEDEEINDVVKANESYHPKRTDERLARVAQAYEREIGALTSAIQQALIEAVDKYPEDWIADAIREAAINNVRKWTYVQRILETWKREGRGATPELRANARARPRAQPKPAQDIDEVLERAKKLAAERGIS